MTPTPLVRLTQAEIRDLVSEVNDLPMEVTDEMAIPTHTHGNPLIRWLFWKRYTKIAELAAIDGSMAVLEFGCGIGVFLPTLARNAQAVFAIDLFPQFAQHLAQAQGLDVQFPKDLAQIPDAAVDVIIAADVLEHIEDLTEVLDAFRAKLKPGGRLLVSGPTENVAYRVGRVIAGFGGKGDYHVTHIGRLRQDISAGGFRLLRSRKLPFPIPPHLFHVLEFGVD